MYSKNRKQYITRQQASNNYKMYKFLSYSRKYEYFINNCKDRKRIERIKDKYLKLLLKMYSLDWRAINE